jgi:hypothetical protein
MRGFRDKDIYEAIAELGKFFRELCSKTLNKYVLVEMKKEIPIILVKLEKNFPPAFFDVMMHLAVHLPDEALLRGPVHYGWEDQRKQLLATIDDTLLRLLLNPIRLLLLIIITLYFGSPRHRTRPAENAGGAIG